MIPTVRFKFSWIYDQNYRKSPGIQRWLKEQELNYPSIDKIKAYIEKAERSWRPIEKKILSEQSKILGLPWHEKETVCYLVGVGIPFSDPLTISIIKRSENAFVDVLTHEMVHQLFMQGNNYENSKKAWDYIYTKYKSESQVTKIHIPLHALHKHILLNFFDKKRFSNEMKSVKSPDYIRSWEIVERDGYEQILQEFTKRII